MNKKMNCDACGEEFRLKDLVLSNGKVLCSNCKLEDKK